MKIHTTLTGILLGKYKHKARLLEGAHKTLFENRIIHDKPGTQFTYFPNESESRIEHAFLMKYSRRGRRENIKHPRRTFKETNETLNTKISIYNIYNTTAKLTSLSINLLSKRKRRTYRARFPYKVFRLIQILHFIHACSTRSEKRNILI